ncbi:hypothetical protein EJ08DRAFT_642225 [Tothia fuscella]|uniref:Uncharacterized protein n=1 Tax=Tothia fuscella TaxID=1048955 RepID=A0A9P4NG32_9PEZI|nr:hypothetical protein EJ08DRAFT_642225 [Tothia fuscella]
MFKPSAPLSGNLRRLALTTKNGPKDYYKGNRVGAMGRHTKRGGYIIELQRVRTYVYPKNIGSCKLTPFVANRIDKEKWSKEKEMENVHGTYDGEVTGPGSGRLYLENWKRFTSPTAAAQNRTHGFGVMSFGQDCMARRGYILDA